MEKCKCRVYGVGRHDSMRGHPCRNNATKDGYCLIHHPDSVEARLQKSKKNFELKRANNPLSRLFKENAELREKVKIATVGLENAERFTEDVAEKYGLGQRSVVVILKEIRKTLKFVKESDRE